MARQPQLPTLAIELDGIQPEMNENSDLKILSKFRLQYLGNLAVDRRYTPAITQWVVREISRVRKSRPTPIDLLIKIDQLIISNIEGGEVLETIGLNSIVRLPRLKNLTKLLAFVSTGRFESDQCFCHVFACETQEMKTAVLHELKNRILESQAENTKENSPPRKSLHPAPASKMSHRRNLSYGGSVPQAEDDLVHRFSVFYVGRVTISQAKAPPKFVDEMLRHIKIMEVENKRKKNGHHDRNSGEVTGNSKHSSSGKIIDLCDQQQNGSSEPARHRSASDGDKRIPTTVPKSGTGNGVLAEENHSKQKVAEISDEVSLRVVTFQISMSSLMLFSAGNKQLLLEKKIREISYCTKGFQRTDHFGFICREKKDHVLYLFQGESEAMVDTIMKAMKQAFNDALQASAHLSLCDTCPIQNLHRLCAKVEESSLSEQQAAVQEHLQSLNETEYSFVMNKFNTNRPDADNDKITLLISLLRAIYDQRQKLHNHNFPGMGLNIANQPHVTDDARERSRTFFEKAKKSLTSSFDNLILRRQRAKTCLNVDTPLLVDTTNSNKVPSDSKRCLSPNIPRTSSDEHVDQRQRSRTFNSCPATPDFQSTCQTRFVIPESDGETKVDLNDDSKNKSEGKNEKEDAVGIIKKSIARQGSWRQQIYNTVTVDSVSLNEEKTEDSRALARARWRKAIMEQIILIRMERENKNLESKISATETRRQKLSYEVYEQCSADAAKTWDELLSKNWKEKVEDSILLSAVKAGVPKYRRGEIWKFLVQQHSIRAPSKDEDPRMSRKYEDLLEEQTTHQHAILIDIGRTFPAHLYFNGQLCAGQIALYNILKSFSLLDDEVGYCQGLSFVAGLILMHMSEPDAFELFRYVMFDLGIRRQYMPDMNAVQQQLYQLTRLLHDFNPNIYNHFNIHDVTPTLYAAPWFLTLFASHYPIGFVVRVMDLIFLQGLEVIFKIGLVLFGSNSSDILDCDGFETIIEYMRDGLPETVKTKGQEYITKALDMDIKYQLNLFEVEYQLLHEEMIDIRQNHERYEKLEAANRELTQQIHDMKCELDYAKESADALRKELIDTKEYVRTAEMLNSQNDLLKLRVAELESELRLCKRKNAFKSAEESNENAMSPASSEVDEIMCRSMERKDGTDGQPGGWELVPSPTTINREMVDVVPSVNSNLNGGLTEENLAKLGEGKHPALVDCKATSSGESHDSMDLISFESLTSFGVSSGVSNSVLSSSEESLLDEVATKKNSPKSNSLKKKRPALPVIHTTGLLATCKNGDLIDDQKDR